MTTTEAVHTGSSKDLTFTFKARDGALADPTSIALTIREPDGVVVAKTEADMTQVSTGVWRYVHAVTKAGRHSAEADGDGVEAAVGIDFYGLRQETGG